jgi:hypothetical protein
MVKTNAFAHHSSSQSAAPNSKKTKMLKLKPLHKQQIRDLRSRRKISRKSGKKLKVGMQNQRRSGLPINMLSKLNKRTIS